MKEGRRRAGGRMGGRAGRCVACGRANCYVMRGAHHLEKSRQCWNGKPATCLKDLAESACPHVGKPAPLSAWPASPSMLRRAWDQSSTSLFSHLRLKPTGCSWQRRHATCVSSVANSCKLQGAHPLLHERRASTKLLQSLIHQTPRLKVNPKPPAGAQRDQSWPLPVHCHLARSCCLACPRKKRSLAALQVSLTAGPAPARSSPAPPAPPAALPPLPAAAAAAPEPLPHHRCCRPRRPPPAPPPYRPPQPTWPASWPAASPSSSAAWPCAGPGGWRTWRRARGGAMPGAGHAGSRPQGWEIFESTSHAHLQAEDIGCCAAPPCAALLRCALFSLPLRA